MLKSDQKIMIVEDDPVLAEDVTMILTNLGCTRWLHCANPVEAERELAGFAPDLVLLDLNFPNHGGARPALAGLSFAQFLQDQAGVNFVIMSAHLSDKDAAQLLPLTRCKGMLVKPFHPSNLQEMVAAATNPF
ncbi:MAG: response regulator [Candidatus Symbiobacter sp.]|nr:response regulator [Candidatus Symbiobacter sp.]